jgi:hypothetical protein
MIAGPLPGVTDLAQRERREAGVAALLRELARRLERDQRLFEGTVVAAGVPDLKMKPPSVARLLPLIGIERHPLRQGSASRGGRDDDRARANLRETLNQQSFGNVGRPAARAAALGDLPSDRFRLTMPTQLQQRRGPTVLKESQARLVRIVKRCGGVEECQRPFGPVELEQPHANAFAKVALQLR